MRVSVVIPYRSAGDVHRARAFVYVHERYKAHEDWEIIVAHCPTKVWSKGAAVNAGAAEAKGDILILADADSFVADAALEEAVERCEAGRGWVVPHGNVYRLTEGATKKVYDGGKPSRTDITRYTYLGPAGGGINVLSRQAFDSVNGMDDRFLGWGGEDICLAFALSTMGYRHLRLDNPLFHLYHPHPAPDLRGSPESEALVARYKQADRNREAMHELLFDR